MAEIVCIGRGTATLAQYKIHEDGTKTLETKANWQPSQGGGSIAIFKMDADTNKVTTSAEVFGDWQAVEYLGRVLELLGPGRRTNLPPLESIIKSMTEGTFFTECPLLEHCPAEICADCIVQEWIEEAKE